jgi:iron(III) transport system permease protein
MNTLSTVIFLASPRWNLAALQILNLADHGYYGKASATAMGMMLCICVTFGAIKLLFKGKIQIFDI